MSRVISFRSEASRSSMQTLPSKKEMAWFRLAIDVSLVTAILSRYRGIRIGMMLSFLGALLWWTTIHTALTGAIVATMLLIGQREKVLG